jgi:hypothetical protein
MFLKKSYKKMDKVEILNKIIETQKEYIKLLSDEINDLAPMAYVHGWATSRYEMGQELRKKISDLEENLNI